MDTRWLPCAAQAKDISDSSTQKFATNEHGVVDYDRPLEEGELDAIHYCSQPRCLHGPIHRCDKTGL